MKTVSALLFTHSRSIPRFFKHSLVLLGIGLATACSHPLDVEGSGRIASNSGQRDCSLQDAPCKNVVLGAYQETYTAIPHHGYHFYEWKGCIPLDNLTTMEGNTCTYTIPTQAVKNNWGKTMPALTAVFLPDGLTPNGLPTRLQGAWRNPCIPRVPAGKDPANYTSSIETYTFEGNVVRVNIENFQGPGCEVPFEPRSAFKTAARFEVLQAYGDRDVIQVIDGKSSIFINAIINGNALYFTKKTGDDDWPNNLSALGSDVDYDEPYFKVEL